MGAIGDARIRETAEGVTGGLGEHEREVVRRRLARGVRGASVFDGLSHAISVSEAVSASTQVRHEILGAGATLGPLLDDPHVTDVVVNGPGQVWADRGRGMERVEVASTDADLHRADGVRALAVRLAASCGQRLDDASPIVDGTFSTGVRLHAVIPPLAAEGTLISLRTHRARAMSIDEFVRSGSLHPNLEWLVRGLVESRANVIISGATGSGKTTFLNSMLSAVPESERILIIEESAELAPTHPHVVHLQVRHANIQGAGEVSMSDLVRAAMRMRPDRIVLGECRGPEVRDVLGALNTGHEGGWATIHANSADDVPARLVALGALANMSEATVAAQAASALDAVVHVARRDGKRQVAAVSVFERMGGELASVPAFTVDGGRVVEGPGADALRRRVNRP